MGKYAKWIGGGFGWALFGPIGALIGFALGSLIDSTKVYVGSTAQQKTTRGDFIMSLLVLVAAVMKSDGKVVKSELDYVKQYLLRSFGPEAASDAVLMLRDMLQQDIPLIDVCVQIRDHLNYSSRLQLLHLLYGIAHADGIVDQRELRTIEQIAHHLGISSIDNTSIKAMFIDETDSLYKILEVEEHASDDEIKKAYRRMAMKYHPDKVSHLGEDVRKTAEEKFKKINEAYEKIKKKRSIV